MPGRHHYAFTLRQLIKMCQCLRRLTDEERANEHYVVSLWSHEMERMIGDQLCRSSDVRWFETSLKQITGEVFSHYFEHNKELLKYFVTFPGEYILLRKLYDSRLCWDMDVEVECCRQNAILPFFAREWRSITYLLYIIFEVPINAVQFTVVSVSCLSFACCPKIEFVFHIKRLYFGGILNYVSDFEWHH